MKVSKRTEYGLRAIVTLAEAVATSNHPLPLRQIAEMESIPEAFLDQIFALLRREGLVQSVRGANGGYLLARAPSDISMGQIIKLLEGDVAPIGCVSDDFPLPEEFCSKARSCSTRSVWVKLNDSILRTLDGISLADVLADAQGEGVESLSVMHL
ncbi:MAG: Rrf2 family transcriptional regulator [Acidibacillus sp.]|uniref:HTH-type transcriptional regulator CymR n=1 Tax=Sulfoacidibacillus ferrooxidans TaxID=2005001 RepID=A0A9X1V7T1_9BACL|nr:HTH-type transcriptional regulator CymR [Sulfoacidibacillus ferrooxidans]MCY0893251.1 Rrf2 family transcriptional regulator [Acidibacillus sp.]